MPELPEVETTRLGIAPHIENRIITAINVYVPKLRWPIPSDLSTKAINQRVLSVTRRAKYLLINLTNGTIIIHLGMSGKLQLVAANTATAKHDHVEIVFATNLVLRLNDPRRFGAVLWEDKNQNGALTHVLLQNLGPEPLQDNFNAAYLQNAIKTSKTAIKKVLMNNKIVVGVGNIYANEILFNAKIHPLLPANKVNHNQIALIVQHTKTILAKAIAQGGTTLKDFLGSNGQPGYFAQQLQVYGRTNELCVTCKALIESVVIGQRNSYFCPNCQTY